MKRDNIDQEFAFKKLAAQLSLEDKIKKCEELNITYSIIDNSNDLDSTYQKINELLKTI